MCEGSEGSEGELLRDEKLLVRARTFHRLAAGGRLHELVGKGEDCEYL